MSGRTREAEKIEKDFKDVNQHCKTTIKNQNINMVSSFSKRQYMSFPKKKQYF